MKVFAMVSWYQGFQPQGHAFVKNGDWSPVLPLPSFSPALRTTLSSSLHVFIKLDCTGKCNESVPGSQNRLPAGLRKKEEEKEKSHCFRVCCCYSRPQLPTSSATVTSEELLAQPPWRKATSSGQGESGLPSGPAPGLLCL